MVLKGLDRHRHGQISLSRPRRPNGERDVVFANRLNVTSLPVGPRADPLSCLNIDRPGARPGNLPGVTGARGARVLGAIYPR